MHRIWLARLHAVLNPLLYVNGSQDLLVINTIPHASEGISVAKQWILDVLFNLDPRRLELQEAFIGNFLGAAMLGIMLDELHVTDTVKSNLLRVPCVFERRGLVYRPHPRLWYGMPGKSRYTLRPLVNFLLGHGNIRKGVEVFS
jgi:hypothetical protein